MSEPTEREWLEGLRPEDRVSSPAHDALDRLESWLDQDSREDVATVRERLDTLTAQVEQLTQERDTLENKLILGRDWLGKDMVRAESAEAENARLTALLETTREGLREIERMAGAAGYGETPAKPIARKARFLLLAASSPPPGDPACPGCGMTAQVAPSRKEPGRWMCHGCAQMFDSPSDGGGA